MMIVKSETVHLYKYISKTQYTRSTYVHVLPHNINSNNMFDKFTVHYLKTRQSQVTIYYHYSYIKLL